MEGVVTEEDWKSMKVDREDETQRKIKRVRET